MQYLSYFSTTTRVYTVLLVITLLTASASALAFQRQARYDRIGDRNQIGVNGKILTLIAARMEQRMKTFLENTEAEMTSQYAKETETRQISEVSSQHDFKKTVLKSVWGSLPVRRTKRTNPFMNCLNMPWLCRQSGETPPSRETGPPIRPSANT